MAAVIPYEKIIDLYHLEPHPEGGHFKETYRSPWTLADEAMPGGFSGERNMSTAIYFLLSEGEKSRFHRLKADELWHFYLGGSMTLSIIHPDGRLEEVILGNRVLEGERVQHLVPGGYWFGGKPNPGTPYSFVGCTTAPGFSFEDFELAHRAELMGEYPQHADLIRDLSDL